MTCLWWDTMANSRSITIPYPSHGMSGAQALGARVAKLLCTSPDSAATIVEYQDGYSCWFLDSHKCHYQLVPVDVNDRFGLPARTTYSAAVSIWNWFGKAIEEEHETKLLLWHIHSLCVIG